VVFLSRTLATQQEQLLVAFERSRNRSKIGLLFPEEEEEEEEKLSLLFFLKLFCELLRNRGVGDLISSLGKKKFSLPWWRRRRRRRRRVFFSI